MISKYLEIRGYFDIAEPRVRIEACIDRFRFGESSWLLDKSCSCRKADANDVSHREFHCYHPSRVISLSRSSLAVFHEHRTIALRTPRRGHRLCKRERFSPLREIRKAIQSSHHAPRAWLLAGSNLLSSSIASIASPTWIIARSFETRVARLPRER